MTIQEILEAHDGVLTPMMHEDYVLHCVCGHELHGLQAEAHRAHVAEVLDKHMQEREAAAVREAGQYIQLLHRGGLVDRKGVLADIEIAADRIGRGLHANGRDKEASNGR